MLSARESKARQRQIKRSIDGLKKGLKLECQVESILLKLVNKRIISSCCRTKHYSLEDREGKDFIITRKTSGLVATRAFGVTISKDSRRKARKKYPNIPQIYFPEGTIGEVISETILDLFTTDKSP